MWPSRSASSTGCRTSLSFEQAAMVEPVSVALHAVGLTPREARRHGRGGRRGMIGLLVIQALRAAGCARVIAVDVDDAKLKLARQLGADRLRCNPNSADVAGCGARTAPAAAARTSPSRRWASRTPLQTALASPAQRRRADAGRQHRPEGRVAAAVGGHAPDQRSGSCASRGEYPACLDLMAAGAIRVEPLISAVAPLAEGPGWFERLYRQEPDLMKVVLNPRRTS